MQTKLTSTQVDISEFPKELDIDTSMTVTDNTVGDLHANPLLEIHALIKKGTIQMSPENYAAFAKLYKLPELQPIKVGEAPDPVYYLPARIFDKNYPNAKERLQEIHSSFKEIIKTIKVIDKKTLFRVIGDDTVDRGVWDAIMALLIDRLEEEGANFEILVSNHGIEFVEACERFHENGKKFVIPRMDNNDHGNSMVALQKSIELGAIDAQQILNTYNKSYKKHLKILSYSLNAQDNEIQIYSHAGIGFNHIKGLVQKLSKQFKGVTYNAENAVEMAKTIDKINEKFAKLVKNNKVHTLYTHDMMYRGYGAKYLNDNDEVFAAVVWNRDYRTLERHSDKFKVTFIHGHDSYDTDKVNHHTLNEGLGQFTNYLGTLKVYSTNGQVAGPAHEPGTDHLEKKPLQAPPQLKPQAPDLSFASWKSLDRDDPLNQAQIYDEDESDFSQSSLGDAGLSTSSLDDLNNPQPNKSSQFDVSEIYDLTLDSNVSDSSLDVPFFELNNSPLGKVRAVVQENLSLSFLDQSSSEFNLGTPPSEVPPIDMSQSTFQDHPDYWKDQPSDDEAKGDDLGRKNRLMMDIPVKSLGKFPSENPWNDTLGDAPEFYTKNRVVKKEDHPKEEMDPSFIMACCGNFTGAEIIGYTLLVALLAVAIVALFVASPVVAATAAAVAVPLAFGLTFFASNKSKEERINTEPGDRLGL